MITINMEPDEYGNMYQRIDVQWRDKGRTTSGTIFLRIREDGVLNVSVRDGDNTMSMLTRGEDQPRSPAR